MAPIGVRILDGRDRSWVDAAACVGMADEVFFPASTGVVAAVEAKEICRRCPVMVACLEYGLREPFGVWGGTTERERRRIRRQRRQRGAA